MGSEEFEKFYTFITKLDLVIVEDGWEEEIKLKYRNELRNVDFKLAMKKANEVYRTFLVPCNFNRMNPKVFSGENPNPGLYGRPEKEDRFYH